MARQNATLGLFDPPPPAPKHGDGLRWYQEEAVQAAHKSLLEDGNRSALVVMATALGKTQTFSAFARRWKDGRVLVLAHRDELVTQAARRLELMTGERVEIEQADLRSNRARIVVGSIQTVYREGRIDALEKRGGFSLIIVDEAHHYVSRTYKIPFERFANAKILGVTATPDRSDAKALGKLFDEVCYKMDIRDGVDHGYLVPLRGREVLVEEVNLDNVGVVNGDLASGALDEELLKGVEGVAKSMLAFSGERQGILFLPGVASARMAAARMNALKDGCAASIDAKTDKAERKAIVDRFRDGRLQFLANCMIACLDEQTEVLTKQGWVRHSEMTMEHDLANWDAGEVYFAKPLAIEVRPRRANEKMFSLSTPRISMRITDMHRVVFRERHATQWSVMRAHELAGAEGKVPIAGMAAPSLYEMPAEPRPKGSRQRRIVANSYALRKRGFSANDALAEAERRVDRADALVYTRPEDLSAEDCMFIGYWFGDGNIAKLKSGGVECYLHNERSLVATNSWLENLLAACGFDYVKRQRGATWQWSIGRGTGFGGQERRGFFRLEPYLDKRGVDLLWSLTDKQLRAVLFGFHCADGNHGDMVAPRSGALSISNTNLALLDKLQAIAVCRGMRASVGVRSNGGGCSPIGTLYVSDRTEHEMTTHTLTEESEWVDELVWCVKSTSSFIIARRNGRVFVTGNTEGFDAPPASVVGIARPTKSRSLYAQMVGRGLRVLPGVVDSIPGREDAVLRQAAIAGSGKPFCTLIDFSGNNTRHSLIGPADMLGGRYDDDVKARAKKMAKEDGNQERDVDELLNEASEQVERERMEKAARSVYGSVKSKTREFNPLSLYKIDEQREREYTQEYGYRPPSERQLNFLLKNGWSKKELRGVSARTCSKLIGSVIDRKQKGLMTKAQANLLSNYGITADMPAKVASAAIRYAKSAGGKMDPIVLRQMVSGEEF